MRRFDSRYLWPRLTKGISTNLLVDKQKLRFIKAVNYIPTFIFLKPFNAAHSPMGRTHTPRTSDFWSTTAISLLTPSVSHAGYQQESNPVRMDRLSSLNPLKPHSSICYTLSYRRNLSFLISDIRALWRWAPECPNVRNLKWWVRTVLRWTLKM